WSQLIGPGILHTIPYPWWKQFEASDIEVEDTLQKPVNPEIVATLQKKFKDFNLAYDEGALKPEQFVAFGATVHTLNQFLGGFQELLGLVRDRMLLPR
ncbi:MAG: transaldolase, partial [Vicinamibacteria bacterium]